MALSLAFSPASCPRAHTASADESVLPKRVLALSVVLLLICSVGVGLRAQVATASIQGTVTDPSGAAWPNATITVKNSGTGATVSTVTDSQGRYSVTGLTPGTYEVDTEARGFLEQKTVGIFLNVGSTALVNVALELGAVTETVEVRAGPATVTRLVWNVWEERYSSSSKASFEPVQKLLTGKPYALILDLAALQYGIETGAFGRPTSSEFDNWLNGSSDSEATVKILVIPDERFFRAQGDGERVKPFEINLTKLRQARARGFKLNGSAFKYLKKHKDSPFTFGRQVFAIQPKSVVGSAAVALSIWADGRPVDELSVPICIVKDIKDPCDAAAPVDVSFNGVDPVSHGAVPDAALHLVELDSATLVGVFRCNSCQGWKPDEFRTWTLGRSAAWFSDMLTKTLVTGFEQASTAADEHAFQNVGTALYHSFFQNDQGISQPSDAEQGFKEFVSAALQREGLVPTPPSIFIRLLPQTSEPLFMFPLGLMSVPLPNNSNIFLGFHFRIETPLELQDYTSSSSCISKWVLLVPPEDIDNQALKRARSAFDGWIQAFDGWEGHAQVDEDLTTFGNWAEQETKDKESIALLIMSHHDTNKLVFNLDTGIPAVFSTNIQRSFTVPSLAIINACGTVAPGAFDFVRELNRNGINSIIATNTEIDGAMAGLFASTLMDVLQAHANDPKYSLDLAKFDAVNTLSKLPDPTNKPYGPRALIFSLIGNGDIKLCTPPRAGRN